MNIPLNAQDLLKLIVEKAFIDRDVRLDIYENGKVIIGDMLNYIEMDVDWKKYQGIIHYINTLTINDMIIVSNGKIEVVLREDFTNSYVRYPNIIHFLTPASDQNRFSIGNVSEVYILYFLYKMATADAFFAFFRSIGKSFILENKRRDFEDFLAIFADQMRTAKLDISNLDYDIQRIKKVIDINLYVKCRNLSAMLSRVNNVNQINPGRQYGNKNNHLLKMYKTADDIPHLSVPEELIYIYQTAFSSNSPEHQFFNFYKIIEHQFFTATYERALKDASKIIQLPNFDPSKIGDIDHLLRNILRNTFYENGDFRVKESIALVDLLRKYEIAEKLEARLLEYDSDLPSYFSIDTPTFCEAPVFDLSSGSLQSISKKISERIYSVRNAIFHNKILSDNRYNSMKHEEQLRPEVALVRAISEIIIENYSYPL